jgi:hypothetical protein
MHTPSAHGLLEAWERGQGRDATWRGLLLLHAAFPDRPEEELAGLALGPRNRLLLGLRIRLFGTELDGLATCGACGETLETRLPLPSPAADDAPALPAPGSPAEVHQLGRDGWTVRYRLPTTGDVMELPPGDVEDSARWLLLRCIVDVEHEGRPVPASELPDDVAGRVVESMSELDPDGVVELVVACPQCGGTSTVPLEPAAFLWAEVDQWAWRVLGEVRDLASAYGWSETDILALSPWRRQAYLELLPA